MRLVEEAVLELVTVMAEEEASNIELRAALIQAAADLKLEEVPSRPAPP